VGALFAGLAAVHPAGVRAATVPVSSCSQAGLMSAIGAAGFGGTVQFTGDCSITLTSTITLPSVTIDGNGHAVTISGGHTSTVAGVQVFVINSGATVTLNDLTIANGHSAVNGGGINFAGGGTLMVTNSTFSGNSAGAGGGGIFINGGGGVTITNSTFSGNSAGAGGGIEKVSGTLTITNSTFSGNSASSFGGGIVNIVSSQPVSLSNTIVAGSATTGGDCVGAITNIGGSLADDPSCGSATQVATAALMLGSLASNGGPTQTIALGSGSVAIDFASANCPSTDQRGFPRPDPGDAGVTTKCDSGAYEFQDPTDTTPPSCALTGVIAGPPKQIQITVQDSDGGLKSVVVTESNNASTVVPAFSVGTTSPLVITATKINQSVGAQVGLQVTDVAGNVTSCDPVLTDVIRAASQPTITTASGIAQSEHLLHIYNGDPGLSHLTLNVNGNKVQERDLVANQQYTVDIAAWLQPGTTNTVTITAHGKPGGAATIVIANA
jgi:hypothetical protein